MLFDEFLKRIPKIEKIPLTGVVSHAKMAPLERLSTLQAPLTKTTNTKVAAVLSLIFPDNKGFAQLILTERQDYQGVHAKQISFPGGKKEPSDAHLFATALRETEEEVGVSASAVKLIRNLSELYIPPSRFLVHPFLGYTDSLPVFRPDPTEVAQLIFLPLDSLLSGHLESVSRLNTSYAQEIDVPAFLFENKVIWGATAMILAEIKDVLLESDRG